MRRMGLKRAAAALLCCCLAMAAGGALAQVEMIAQMGYDGVVTYLRRLPVTVELTNNGADATGELIFDAERSEVYFDRYSMPLTVAAGATVRVTLPVTLTMKQSAYSVQWLVDGQVRAGCPLNPAVVLNPSYLVVGVLSEDPQKLSYLNLSQRSDVLKRGEYWQTVALDAASFPADAASMRFFDMLVVDGVDLSVLGKEQQAALDTWLRGGGVVLLGGGAQAAAAFPFFEGYTGISAGQVAGNEALSQELLELFKLSEVPLAQEITTVALEGAKGRSVGEDRLVDVSRVDGGYIFTAAFSISEKPLNAWLGKHVIWQRMLLKYAQSRYQSMTDTRTYGLSSNAYADFEAASNIPVPNGDGMGIPLVILAVFVGMVGFGSYFLLKKRDRSSLMWATAPGLAILCSLLIWAVSGALGLQKPIVTSYTMVDFDKDGAMTANTGLCVAQAASGPMTVRLNQGSVNMDSETSNYYDGEATAENVVKKLRYQYELGASEAVTSALKREAWSVASYAARDVPIADVKVSGEAGWEDGSLVFRIHNQGTVALSDGLVVTNYGFVSVQALLPGQTVTAKMVPNKENIVDSSKVKDGMLLNETERRLCSFYDFFNAYRSGNQEVERQEMALRNSLLSSYANQADWYSSTGVGDLKYFAFSDELAQVELSLNGEAVTRKGQKDMVCATLAFSPVAADGTVRFLSGNVPMSPAELDDQGKPQAVEQSSGQRGRYASYRLSDEPVFAFDMSEAPESWKLEHFDIAPRYSYYSYEISLYRVRDGQWVGFKSYEYDQNTGKDKSQITLPRLSDYVDGEGMLYARFTQYGKGVDYADIDTPSLTMDGRLK